MTPAHLTDPPGLSWWCPGCRDMHAVGLGLDGWTWDGSVAAPTIRPSVLVRSVRPGLDEVGRLLDAGLPLPVPTPQVCHSWITAGKIEYLGDCTHELVGQTVPMIERPSGDVSADQSA